MSGSGAAAGVALAVVAAVLYGASDFAGGLGGRRGSSGAVAVVSLLVSLVPAAAAVAIGAPETPGVGATGWAALAGVGSGVGTLALYRGLATGRMSVVAPLSAVLAAVVPALVGLATGDRLSALAWTGIGVAVPAIALVSWASPDTGGGSSPTSGAARDAVVSGVAAGAGFGLLFVGLARAGTAAGAWPLVVDQVVALSLVLAVTLRAASRPRRSQWRASTPAGAVAGVLGGLATLTYLVATGHGELVVVAVVTSLYPAATVLLARAVLRERWGRAQALGMLAALGAVVLVGGG